MSKLISTVLGFVIAVVAFMAIQKLIPAISKNIFVAGFIFVVLLGGGICISYVAWWLALIIGVIALIIYAIKKRKPLEIKDEDIIDSTAEENTTNETTVSEGDNEL